MVKNGYNVYITIRQIGTFNIISVKLQPLLLLLNITYSNLYYNFTNYFFYIKVPKPLATRWCLDPTPAAPGALYDEDGAFAPPLDISINGRGGQFR